MKRNCLLCKTVGVLVIIGALNWGLVVLFNLDLVAKFLGPMTTAAKARLILRSMFHPPLGSVAAIATFTQT